MEVMQRRRDRLGVRHHVRSLGLILPKRHIGTIDTMDVFSNFGRRGDNWRIGEVECLSQGQFPACHVGAGRDFCHHHAGAQPDQNVVRGSQGNDFVDL